MNDRFWLFSAKSWIRHQKRRRLHVSSRIVISSFDRAVSVASSGTIFLAVFSNLPGECRKSGSEASNHLGFAEAPLAPRFCLPPVTTVSLGCPACALLACSDRACRIFDSSIDLRSLSPKSRLRKFVTWHLGQSTRMWPSLFGSFPSQQLQDILSPHHSHLTLCREPSFTNSLGKLA